MARVIWKGAISFGLVHVPVALYPATSSSGIDFDWLDKRSMDPVGYKRVNKRTGKEIESADIVKGIKVEGGDYVVLSDDEIKAAYPKTTQTIAIETFVQAGEVPFVHLETPYYLEPIAKGEKVYALLREAMVEAGVIGIARVVIHTKEHLAALLPVGPALMLDTLRWANEIRPWTELQLPPEGRKAAQLKDAELKMATQLIASMTDTWDPERYSETFTAAVHQLVAQRIAAGQTEAVQPLEEAAEPGGASNVVDLMELLSKSLGKRPGAAGAAPAKSAKVIPAKGGAAKKTASRPAAKKTAARKRA